MHLPNDPKTKPKSKPKSNPTKLLNSPIIMKVVYNAPTK